MRDQARVSSGHVRAMLTKHTEISEQVINKLEIVTEISRADRALTTVERPGGPYNRQNSWDQAIQQALRKLPDADPAIVMTMGRAFTVEWAGICRPV
jgi:hypothetical protein